MIITSFCRDSVKSMTPWGSTKMNHPADSQWFAYWNGSIVITFFIISKNLKTRCLHAAFHVAPWCHCTISYKKKRKRPRSSTLSHRLPEVPFPVLLDTMGADINAIQELSDILLLGQARPSVPPPGLWSWSCCSTQNLFQTINHQQDHPSSTLCKCKETSLFVPFLVSQYNFVKCAF